MGNEKLKTSNVESPSIAKVSDVVSDIIGEEVKKGSHFLNLVS